MDDRCALEVLARSRSAPSRIMPADPAITPLPRLSFWRARQVSWQRLVEWGQYLARHQPPAFQCHLAGHSGFMAFALPDGRHRHLHSGNRLHSFYLAQENAAVLADLYAGCASRYRNPNGTVSVFLYYDRPQ